MMKMNDETQIVYQKYGVSPSGSCLQLLIQMPILFALWQVIYKIPAYVSSVRAIFDSLITDITGVNGFTELINTFITDNKLTRVRLILEDGVATNDSLVDFLYALSPSQWTQLSEVSEFSGFTDSINSTASEISKLQNFLGLNIAETPWYYVRNVVAGGSILLAIIAVLIPILSWLTQVLNMKLMPQTGQVDDNSTMGSSMKTMNTVMPLMSLFFCFTFPVGMGIYWVISAVVRSVQQVLINRHLDKIDMDELVNANMKKIEAKRAKKGLPPSKINKADITSSLTSEGCIITDCKLNKSVIGVRSIIEKGTELDGVIMMGADYYDDDDEKADYIAKGKPVTGIGKNCKIANTIIDKNARIGDNCQIGVSGKKYEDGDHGSFYSADGIIVIRKGAVIPSGTVI